MNEGDILTRLRKIPTIVLPPDEALIPAVRVIREIMVERSFAAAEIERLRECLEASVKLQSHYASLLNMYDGGQRMTFASAAAWLERLKEVKP